MTSIRRLPGEVTIYSVSELKVQCLAWMGASAPDNETGGDRWPLDASAVDQIDAAGIQLLIALSRSLARLDKTLLLQQPSVPLATACAALGLTFWLDSCTTERGAA